jgi:Acyclic terpene utilisation family protein AtuA
MSAATDEISVVTPVGCIGNRGVEAGALAKAIATARPACLAMDAGSLDCGPWYLGAGEAHSPSLNIRWDLETILGQAVPARIPVIIGSAGGSGGPVHVAKTLDQVRAAARERDLKMRVAVIHADVDPATFAPPIVAGAVAGSASLDDGRPLLESDIRGCDVLVGAMGAEPIVAALEEGADLVLCGRAVDASVIAAYPVWKGFDRGLAHHMGDILECAELVAEEIAPTLRSFVHNRIPIIGTIGRDHFDLRPALDTMACTPRSCLMHSFYERTDIETLRVPGGAVDKSASRYEQVDRNTTRITGSRWRDEPYSVLFEGVRRIGHRAVCIFGIRNARMIAHLDEILAELAALEQQVFSPHGKVAIHWHQYGRKGVLGPLERASDPHEVGVVADIIADTPELAKDVGFDLRNRIAFWRYPGRATSAGNIAVTFSPSVIAAGEVFEMSVYHTVPISDWRSIFRIETLEL